MLNRLPLCFFVLSVFVASGASGAGNLVVNKGSSYSFTDDEWVGGPPRGSTELMPQLLDKQWPCSLSVGGRPSVTIIQRDERLSSYSTDNSANKSVDVTGHAVNVSGIIVTEVGEVNELSMASGHIWEWSIGGERDSDETGSHSWTLLTIDASPYAGWLPIQVYSFSGDTPALLDEPSSIGAAETSTWAMMALGFAGLGFAGYRGRRLRERPAREGGAVPS